MKKSFFGFVLFLLFIVSSNVFAYRVTSQTSEEIAGPSDWAAEEIQKASDCDLLTNEVSAFYREYITRKGFAGLIVRCVEKLTGELNANISAEKVSFKDTADADVLKAASVGIVKGIGDGIFAPDYHITRQEIAVMMYRAISFVESKKGITYMKDEKRMESFTDKNMVADWAADAVGILCNNKIMMGTSQTTLSPLLNATKEEAILLDNRIYDLMR